MERLAEQTAGRVVYITYNGLTEPLGRRQVVPYLQGLSQRGWAFTVVSFEKEKTADRHAVAAVTALLGRGTRWRRLRYHASVPATAYDVLRGSADVVRVGRSAGILHARSTVAAAMASLGRALLGIPWVFDVRGLLAEEYADAGHWRPHGILYRVTAAVERHLMRKADGLVFLTHRIRDAFGAEGILPEGQPAAVIPCCVDMETFRRSSSSRERIRTELGVGDAPLIVYSGSLGSWYRLEEMLDFHQAARRTLSALRFLILTPQTEVVTKALERRPETGATVMMRHVTPDEIPGYLSAGDAGICFLGNLASKRASSPTKYGEYLAAGLPVITNRWTGDAASLDGEAVWILIDDFGEHHYLKAADELGRLLARPEATADAARTLAQRGFSLELAVSRYDALYREVIARSL